MSTIGASLGYNRDMTDFPSDLIDRLAAAMLRSEQMGKLEIEHCRRTQSEDWMDARRYARAALSEMTEADLRGILAHKARGQIRSV